MILIFLLLCMMSSIFSKLLYNQDHKICNPKQQTPFFPFTGFKITRQYKISGYTLPVSMHFITISHCNHGQVDYQKVIRTDSSGNIDWDKPFCMLKPKLGEMLTLPASDVIGDPEEQDNDEENDEFFVGVFGFIMYKGKKMSRLFRKKLDIQLEKFTNGRWLEYTGKNKYYHHKDLMSKDPQSSLEWESRNLVCYKMARRKKYAKRKIDFFMPHTFVGGLFECILPMDLKRQIFHQFTSSDFVIQQIRIECDPNLSRPISPLIAEDSTTQWFENKLHNVVNPGIIQTIPYLTTSTPLNLRFSTSETPDMFRDSWATKIEVNENYIYREADLHLISRAIALSADLLNKLISPIDFNSLIRSYNKASERENPNIEHDEDFLQGIKWEQKVNLWLATIDRKISNKILTQIEGFWSNIED
ncbi:conserved hypothetical protein [Candida tropicalis MYA-3404]|uniref:Uncharacterized protein n=1 Tax=Candida tropicalis (strain ATCC MYA-3404 / T1) TaxID=294747 RepID=C5MCS4_CANTT|nr:conserved hypothetical protein [Candida tropicalis MYA-3404]EER32354.1 conserved hypothetical protein [Candida tropicalis MYA-3404]KAG4405962.1 hypothetical protein JTP64_004833 [Candida tropicalis]